MELLKISETKMKIMLDRADMRRFRVDAGAQDYGKSEVREAFFGILDEVRRRSGFDVADGKALVQCYPSKDGGCELFVTKLGSFPEATERAITKAGNAAMLTYGKRIYYFGDFETLLAAARALRSGEGLLHSDAFAGEAGGYYLVVEERNCGAGKSGISPSAIAAEYGSGFARKNERGAMLYINEHAARLTEGNAVALLSAL